MTSKERIITVLRDCGAANAWFDDSSPTGHCWQVDTSDAWYEQVADQILSTLKEGQITVSPMMVTERVLVPVPIDPRTGRMLA